MAGSEEEWKLKQHLELLREEHVKLQAQLVALQKKYDILEAANIVLDSEGSNASLSGASFVTRLVKIVAELFEKDLYSDITIHLDGHQVRAHRFVLAARSENWGVPDLSLVDRLDFSNMSYNIGYTLLRWVYTDQLENKLGDSFLLDLMKGARRFSLEDLFKRCENLLISRLDVKNCVGAYQAADDIEALKLRDKASQLISARWDDFSSSDFETMSAQLLYKMLRSKADFPIHSAVRLEREDVVFLYLIEFDSELEMKLNEPDHKGDLPLGLALKSDKESIAKTLVSHKANLDGRNSQGKPLLYEAVEREDAFACNFLLGNNAEPNCEYAETKKTPLHLLASLGGSMVDSKVPGKSEGMTEVLEKLLAKRLEINRQDKEGRTALHLATLSRNLTAFDRILVQPGIDVEILDNCDKSPLCLALTQPSLNMAEKLVAKGGADVNAISDSFTGNTLLHDNVICGRKEAVEFLIGHKVDVNALNEKKETPLHLACREGLEEIVKALLDAGASPNLQTTEEEKPGRQTPLHLAIANGHVNVIKEMLGHNGGIKPDFSLTDTDGESALGFALWSGLFDVAQELISGGADVNTKSADDWSLLLRAITAGDGDAADFLIKNGADAAIKSPDGRTALQLAAGANLPGVVRSLCKAGADMNIKNDEGLPPLWVALELEEEDVASALVENGCDADAWGPGPGGCRQTLLHRAIDENNGNAACFLIRSFCDVNAVRKPGPSGEGDEEAFDKQTPLHMAVTWGLDEVVSTLIEHGANVNSQDVEGKSPVHLAVLNHHENILSLLLRSKTVGLTVKDKRGVTPFAAAMQAKNNSAAQAILKREPRVATQVDNKGFNFLHTAVKGGDLESVLFLLSVHVDVNQRTEESSRSTPLHLACAAGDEMIVRNLILAGAEVGALTNRKQSCLHIAASNEKPQICSILLENHINPDCLDADQNNALHSAIQKGSLGCVKILLTESQINATAVNLKGQTPLHILGQSGKENSAAIFELFLELMPDHPIDKLDLNGNTPLLLAYMTGNAQLCKAIVKRGACLGATNFEGISVFTYQTPTKQLLFRLLDQLAAEPKWAEGDNCSECGMKFSITTRKHHCRHCGRLLCAKCSERSMPILKYDLQKPVRVCDVCYDVLTLGAQS